MHYRLALIATSVAALAACHPVTVPSAIPPSATSAPLELPDPDEAAEVEELVSMAQPRERCEVPPLDGFANPDFAPTRELIDVIMSTTGVPSIAVAVARDGKILWEEGFGFADPRRRIRATKDTMYSLASISKPFTATGIMVLQEKGLLALDQPMTELLPEPGLRAGVGSLSDVTIERVASHTGGFPLHYQFFYEGGDAKVPSLQQTREHYGVPVIEPGSRYQYSNLGYGLLGQVIEHVGGKPFPEFMREEVFEPLDLRHTFVGRPPRGAGVEAIRFDGRGKAIPRYGFDHDGASAVYSSAHDLVRFGMFHAGTTLAEQGQPLSIEARAKMQQVVEPANYGLGWSISRAGGLTRVSHNGGMPGVRTMLRILREHKVVIVVLTNASGIGGGHMAIADEIEHAIGLSSRADDLCTLPLDHAVLGTWEGELVAIDGPRRFVLEARPTGELWATFGDAKPRIVRGVRFSDGRLVGETYGDVGAEQGGGKATIVRIDLTLLDGKLQGGVTASVPRYGATTALAVLSHR